MTRSLGKLSGVSARLVVMLTKRRAVDLCRVADSLLLLLLSAAARESAPARSGPNDLPARNQPYPTQQECDYV